MLGYISHRIMASRQSLPTFRRVAVIVGLTSQHTQALQDSAQAMGARERRRLSHGRRAPAGKAAPHLFSQEEPM